MEVLEGQNILVTISGKKNRVRVYYLSWLKSKILRTDGLSDVSLEFFINFIQFIKYQNIFNQFFFFNYSKLNDEMDG